MYSTFVSSLQVTVLAALYLLVKPLIRRRVSYSALWVLVGFLFFLLYHNVLGTCDLGASLFTLPWPMPHISSPVAALDYPDTTPAWIGVADRVWTIGMFACLGAGVLGYAVFRIRVARMSRPACARIQAFAQELFTQTQTSAWLRRCKEKGETPDEETLAKLRGRKPPKVLVTRAVAAPASIVMLPCRVLLDREDYTDEQLDAILRHEFAHTQASGSQMRLWIFFGAAMSWFNPLVWFMRRESRRVEELYCDETAVQDKSDEEKRAYANLLLDIAGNRFEAPGAANVGGGALKDRLTALFEKPKHPIRDGILALALSFAFLFGRGLLVRPMNYFQANAQSVVAILGANEEELQINGERNTTSHTYLMPFDADYTLYGAIGAEYYAYDKDHVIREVALHYDGNTDPKAVRDGIAALQGYLTDRLGNPKAARRTRAIGSDNAISWKVTTKSGEKAGITFVQWNRASCWTDATSGGALVKLYWDIDIR